MFITFGFMFHLFMVSTRVEPILIFLYALFLIINVFAYTSLLDGKKYAIYSEGIKFMLGVGFMWLQEFSWFGTEGKPAIIIGVYLFISLGMTIYFLKAEPKSHQLTPA